MKRTITLILFFLLVCGMAVAIIGFLLENQSSHQVSARQAQDPNAKKTNTITYKGVSFTFDRSLALEVKAETIPAMVDGKPSDIVPEHPAFRMVGYPRPKGLPDNDPQIRVFSIAKFREAVAIASKENAKSVVYPSNPPDWTAYFDEEVRVLKLFLATKPVEASAGHFLAKARGKPGCSAAMPFLPMWEACQAFAGHIRYVNFKNGQGVFFLTQWDTETEQISNDGLEYAYQGFTNDGRYWVYAEFSVTTSFLPKGDEPEVMAWNEKNYLLSHQSKKYQDYLRPVLAKLKALPASKFQPSLELLEQLIGSFEVKAK